MKVSRRLALGLALMLVLGGAVAAALWIRERSKVYAVALDFAAYGDCRHHPEIHGKICQSMAKASPAFVIMTGDLVDHAELPAQWAVWEETTRDLRARSRYYCAAGNHDLSPEGLYKKTLGLERLYFDRMEGDIHLFVLDSNSHFADDPEQVAWLEKTALASKARHKFAVFHHPPFLIDHKRAPEMEDLRAIIHPLLKKLKFCGAFCGHQHGYYTTVRDGMRYMVTAGGGAPLWDLDPAVGLPADQSRKFHHFMGFQRVGGKILGHVYDKSGVEDVDLAFTLCDHP